MMLKNWCIYGSNIQLFYSYTHQWWGLSVWKKCDLITCSQQMLIIIWSVSEILQLNGAPWRWCQCPLKHVGAIINMWSSIHRIMHERWSIEGGPARFIHISTTDLEFIIKIFKQIELQSIYLQCWHLLFTTDHTPCLMLNCFFSLISYTTQNTVCFSYLDQSCLRTASVIFVWF